MKTILITGGNGFLGRYVASALQDRGDIVRVLALEAEDTTSLEKRGVLVYRGDVREPDTLLAPLQGVDAVLHLAGLMGVWRPMGDYRAINVQGTENVCRAALAVGALVVHVSSWTVYGMGVGRPVTEEFPLRPMREPYAVSKAEGDLLVQRLIAEENLPAVIIRPGTIFGPGSELNFGRLADRVRTGKWIIVGSGQNALPLVYVSDVVQGLLLALDKEQALGRAYNITNDRPLSQRDFFGAVATEIGARLPRMHVPYHLLFGAAWASELIATRLPREPFVTRHGVALFGTENRHPIDRAKRELGYAPQVDLREGVRRAADWYRDKRESAAAPRFDAPVAGVAA